MSYVGLLQQWTADKPKTRIRKTVVVLCVVVVVGIFLIVSYYNVTSTTNYGIYKYKPRGLGDLTIIKLLNNSSLTQNSSLLINSKVVFQSGNILKEKDTPIKGHGVSWNENNENKLRKEDVHKNVPILSRTGYALEVNKVDKIIKETNRILNDDSELDSRENKWAVSKLKGEKILKEVQAYEYNLDPILDEDDFEFKNETRNDAADDDDFQEIDWNDPRLDILHMPKLEFDSRFKNPCWFEPLTSPTPYKNNSIVLYSPSAKKTLQKLTQTWEHMFTDSVDPERLRCVPYFMIIGQPKCGSTDLFWKIVKHPDIDHPPIKELHWWTRSRQGRRFSYRRLTPFNDYVDMFDRPAMEIQTRVHNLTDLLNNDDNPRVREQIITGEASVSLFWDNNDWMMYPENSNRSEPMFVIPHYIHHIIPDVKLILMLREPVERLYSDYLYFHSKNKSADDFHRAVTRAIQLYKSCIDTRGARACVYDKSLSTKVRVRIRVGMYSVFLKDWLSVFSRSQFFILRLVDYSADQINYIRQIYTFLGQRQLSVEEENSLLLQKRSNVRKDSDQALGGMHESTRKLLHDFYRPFNIDLAAILHDKRYLWTD